MSIGACSWYTRNNSTMEPITTTEHQETPLLWTLTQIASVWIISDIGYYVFLPAFGIGGSYTANPLQITIYYFIWLLLTIFSFWGMYRTWNMFERNISTYIVIFVGTVLVVSYLTYILPLFPPIAWATPTPPSELLIATSWFFLPKSIDIMLQQLLVVAMVLAFSLQKYSLKTISVWCALLFGGAHLLLVFGKESVQYVALFTLSAVVASFIFPYLILRVKNGLVYSYFLHWLFYAVAIVIAHMTFSTSVVGSWLQYFLR